MRQEMSVKERIIRSSWELFYQKGFEDTTLNDIIEAARISKGTFYYYFRSKNTLLNTLSVLLDDEYRAIEEELTDDMTAFDKLMYLNDKIHTYIGEKISYKLMANQYSSHLLNHEESNLLDKNRYYYQLTYKIVVDGQKKGELIDSLNAVEVVNAYSMCERALVTEWCMSDGNLDLGEISRQYMPMLFAAFKA